MKLEQQVTSLEISKDLKELGINQSSSFYWFQMKRDENDSKLKKVIIVCHEDSIGQYPQLTHVKTLCCAFTVAELGEMLPEWIKEEGREYFMNFSKSGKDWYASYGEYSQSAYLMKHLEKDLTEADSRGWMLIYLLENKLITV